MPCSSTRASSMFSQHQANPPPACPARPRLSLLRPSRTETGHNPPSMVPSRPQPHPGSRQAQPSLREQGGVMLVYTVEASGKKRACQARPRQTRHHPPTPHAQHRAKTIYMPQCSPRRATLPPLRTPKKERALTRGHTAYTYALSLLKIRQGSSQIQPGPLGRCHW